MVKQSYFKDLWEVSLSTKANDPATAGILQNIFLNAGMKTTELVELRQGQQLKVTTYIDSQQKLNRLKKILTPRNLPRVSVRTRFLASQDWTEKWKKGIKPFYLADDLYVIPAWQKSRRIPKSASPILLDTTFAFGTGLHETTRFMSEFIVQMRGRFQSFLDVGTGSGLLSVVAAHCDAKIISALDFDPQCIVTAKNNMRINGYQFNHLWKINVYRNRLRQQYDFVAANLVSADLLALGKKLTSWVRSGKYLAISGILLENLSKVQKHYESLPLKLVKKLSGRQWGALLYVKK